MEEWVEKYPLYFIAWTEQQGKTFDLGYVNNAYQNVKVVYSQEEENAGTANDALLPDPIHTRRTGRRPPKENSR